MTFEPPMLRPLPMRFEPVREHLCLEDSLILYGSVVAMVEVFPGASLHLYGPCVGKIIVHPGSKVVVYSTVTGKIRNLGGELVLYGQVVGEVTPNEKGTYLASSARLWHPPR